MQLRNKLNWLLWFRELEPLKKVERDCMLKLQEKDEIIKKKDLLIENIRKEIEEEKSKFE